MATEDLEIRQNYDTECETETKIDRLSNLPWKVLDRILVKLPIADAIKTSILSKQWRLKWGSLSQFSIETDKDLSWSKIRKFVYHYMLYHSGTINKFKLSATCKQDYRDLYFWIHFLSEKSVEEFVLEHIDSNFSLELPSTLFCLQQLTHLQLRNCKITLPCRFKGFNFLSSLHLRQVHIDDNMLEKLILNCCLLERLTLLEIYGLDHLKIQSPNLKYLKLDSKFKNISFVNTQQLISIDVSLKNGIFQSDGDSKHLGRGIACNLLTALSGLSGDERLSLSTHFFKFLAIEDATERLPIACNNFRVIDLHDINSNDAHVFRISLSIHQMFSHLSELNVLVNSSDSTESSAKFLDGQKQLDFFFHKLLVVRLRYTDRMGAAIEFLKLILGHSPMLNIVTVTKHGKITLPEKKIRKTFQRLKQASPQVKIVYQATGSSISYLF